MSNQHINQPIQHSSNQKKKRKKKIHPTIYNFKKIPIMNTYSKNSIPIIDEETYLTINGASRQDIGDSALHKNKGNNSDKTWSKIIAEQAKKDKQLIEKREELRKEYWDKVQLGEIRPPTRIENLIMIANGHPENEATLAARRLLTKRNIHWRW